MNNQEILPEPVASAAEQGIESAETDMFMNEKDSSKVVENQPGVQSGAAAISGMGLSSAQQAVGGAVTSSTDDQSMQSPANGTGITSSLSADDLDLIEKEWVKKAKEIVEATHNDPHLQSDQLSKVKADYIKKRYGKDVKVKEGKL